MERRVLTSSQSTSSEFYLPGGQVHILMDGHAGGTWTLQVLSPAGNWVDLGGDGGVTFESDGMVAFNSVQWLKYRLTGGTAGPQAWFLPNITGNAPGAVLL